MKRPLPRVWLALVCCFAATVALSAWTISVDSSKPPAKFDTIVGIAAVGNDVWVVNQVDEGHPWGSVTELSATTGKVVRIIRGRSYQFLWPAGLAVGGGHVWVTDWTSGLSNSNGGNNPGAITEFSASSGHLERIIRAPGDSLGGPTTIALSPGHLWVGNAGKSGVNFNGSVVLLDSSTERSILEVGSKDSEVGSPYGMAVAGGHTWIQNGREASDNTVTVLDARTGGLFRVESLSPAAANGSCLPGGIAATERFVWAVYQGCQPDTYGSAVQWDARTGAHIRTIDIAGRKGATRIPSAVTAAGNEVWIADEVGGPSGMGAVTELNAITGKVVRQLDGSSYRFNDPSQIAISSGRVWVANSASDSVIEIQAATGKLIRVIS